MSERVKARCQPLGHNRHVEQTMGRCRGCNAQQWLSVRGQQRKSTAVFAGITSVSLFSIWITRFSLSLSVSLGLSLSLPVFNSAPQLPPRLYYSFVSRFSALSLSLSLYLSRSCSLAPSLLRICCFSFHLYFHLSHFISPAPVSLALPVSF